MAIKCPCCTKLLPTDAEIEAAKAGGEWDRATLEKWGEEWPPRDGLEPSLRRSRKLVEDWYAELGVAPLEST